MLFDLVSRAQRNEEGAILELLSRFQPLMRKYARKLDYEDSYEDIILYFIQMIKKMNLNKLTSPNDEVIVSYINVCIKNFYNKRVSRMIEAKKEIVLSALTEEQLYYAEVQTAKTDEENIFVEFAMKGLLNENEARVIHLVYVEGYSIAEIARVWKRTRQSVNQLKQRALNKVRKAYLLS